MSETPDRYAAFAISDGADPTDIAAVMAAPAHLVLWASPPPPNPMLIFPDADTRARWRAAYA